MLEQQKTPEEVPLAFLPATDGDEGQSESPVAGACSCATCARMPLLGEVVTLVEQRGRRVWICDLCLATDGDRWTEIRRDRVHTRTARLVVRRISD